jgi:class 3 adenylate cyclase/DNA-binding transcriptional MerR regulator
MAVHNMITSKDIISKTGISRATLNNYIKLGILPRPVVGPPRPGDHGVKQIGYFPEEVIARLDRVRLMKDQGKSMGEISSFFQADHVSGVEPVGEDMPLTGETSVTQSQARPYTRSTDRDLKVTICDITSPAYLVNSNFEVEWINNQAEDFLFARKVHSLVDSESRNIFRLCLEQRQAGRADGWIDLASLHMTVLQKNIGESGMSRLYTGITEREVNVLRDIYNSRKITTPQQVYRLPVSISLPGNVRKNYLVHTMKFREGTFFVYIPDEGIGSDLMSMLGNRERVIGDLLKHRMPSLVSLCVLVADLQDSVRISAELLPAQYFELINGLWECTGPVFEKYNGVYGKHVGDGVLYYFLDKPGGNYINDCINCAIDLRDVVFEFSEKWKESKGWDNDLFLNTGINEGQEFFGTIRSADKIEFTALGDTINTAARLSEFARNGQIWTTKNLVSKFAQEERSMLRFGVHRSNNPDNRFVRDSFARVADLVPEENLHYRHFCTIAGLPITEIKERIKPVLE